MRLVATLCTFTLLLQGAGVRQPPRTSNASSSEPTGVTPVRNAERAWLGADVLMPLALSDDPDTQRAAIRAVGRLEDPRLVPQLLAIFDTPRAPRAVLAAAIAQSLNKFDPQADPALIANVVEHLRKIGEDDDLRVSAAVALPIGRIAYSNGEQVAGVERVLIRIMDRTRNDKNLASLRHAAARSFESLARLNAKVARLGADSITTLARSVAGTYPNDHDFPEIRESALMALISARALESDSEQTALADSDWTVRRVAMNVLAAGGGPLDDETRIDAIYDGLGDKAPLVRYEAVRAYVRHAARSRGCDPIAAALLDPASHVALAAFDALGDLCQDDEGLTNRIIAEARTPPVIGPWQREAHAFVALAKRAPDRAAISMLAFADHPVWQVRMYAARAAAAMKDLVTLNRLAYDPSDNVREDTLGALRRLEDPNADRAILAALERNDYQLLRTAAILLKDSHSDRRLVAPLTAALLRLSVEGNETSHDARLALLDAIEKHGSQPEEAERLRPLVKDYDARVAEQVAAIVTRWTGIPTRATPTLRARGSAQSFDGQQDCVGVDMRRGRTFRMRMLPDAAPIAVDQFLKLGTIDRYYNGLTFHRIVPNFVIQGGSPGANEYSSALRQWMRDEITLPNVRGSVGLSTRGRNTGDGQFYVNLVDNPRLDADYTIFGQVLAADMDVVDAIEEGDEIAGMKLVSCR
jgi:cyclophilin family peptidyl-prolyl cis-trans isomerase/HEAT repeat protein